MKIQAKHIIVHGRVQGVGFRYFVRDAAARLELAGDVRNRPDSTVEIVVEGPSGPVGEFVREVGRGPALARVERLDVDDLPAGGNYRSFTIEGR
jgi:acylphosphatase